jgi:hypothetical protein
MVAMIIISGCKVYVSGSRENLNLSGAGINEIPSNVFLSKKLKRLDLGPKGFMEYGEFSVIPDSPNNISIIPTEISNLQELAFLDLSFNKIKQLPSSIAKLRNLEFLDISFNYGLEMAKEKHKLYGMFKLKYLNITCTNFDSLDISDLREKLNEKVIIIKSMDDLRSNR